MAKLELNNCFVENTKSGIIEITFFTDNKKNKKSQKHRFNRDRVIQLSLEETRRDTYKLLIHLEGDIKHEIKDITYEQVELGYEFINKII